MYWLKHGENRYRGLFLGLLRELFSEGNIYKLEFFWYEKFVEFKTFPLKGSALKLAILLPAFARTSRRPSPGRVNNWRGVYNAEERFLLGLHQDSGAVVVVAVSVIPQYWTQYLHFLSFCNAEGIRVLASSLSLQRWSGHSTCSFALFCKTAAVVVFAIYLSLQYWSCRSNDSSLVVPHLNQAQLWNNLILQTTTQQPTTKTNI